MTENEEKKHRPDLLHQECQEAMDLLQESCPKIRAAFKLLRREALTEAVQAFIPQPTVEAFHVGILHRFAWLNEL